MLRRVQKESDAPASVQHLFFTLQSNVGDQLIKALGVHYLSVKKKSPEVKICHNITASFILKGCQEFAHYILY